MAVFSTSGKHEMWYEDITCTLKFKANCSLIPNDVDTAMNVDQLIHEKQQDPRTKENDCVTQIYNEKIIFGTCRSCRTIQNNDTVEICGDFNFDIIEGK